MNTQRVWITGANGLIGSALVNSAAEHAPEWQVRSLTHAELELRDSAGVRAAFSRDTPDALIHCAGLTKNADCQQHPALARQLNVEVTALLAELAADIPFFFFSTDLVFDGRRGNYVESDPIKPLTVYAETKAAAERVVLSNPRHTVVRTSLNGGRSPSGNRGFNEQMRLAWQAGQTLTLFTDEFRCPIPVVITAQAVWALLRRNAAGLFHLNGAERLSRWQLGQLLADRWPGVQARLVPGSLKDYPGPARSPDTSLNCAKIQRLLPFRIPGLSEWLAANPNAEF